MMDSYELVRPAIEAADYPGELGYKPGSYGVVTLHRPSNVDVPEQLDKLVEALVAVQGHLPLIFPVHPRTRQRLGDAGAARLEGAGITLVGPAAYVRFMSLVAGAAAVITDSGGIQEETTYLGIPCLTLRENTERPITISEGTAQLVNAGNLLERLLAALAPPRHVGRPDRAALRRGSAAALGGAALKPSWP
jgi:UDP-N-acetylglucosamine 2-epimerase (non-hydrolysing)